VTAKIELKRNDTAGSYTTRVNLKTSLQ